MMEQSSEGEIGASLVGEQAQLYGEALEVRKEEDRVIEYQLAEPCDDAEGLEEGVRRVIISWCHLQ